MVPELMPVELPVRAPETWLDTVRGYFGRRRALPAARPVRAPAQPPRAPAAVPVADSNLARGLREIRESDPGFDPSRIAGYVGMIFRATQQAWMTGEIGPLRDRMTPELHGEMQAQCDRLRHAGRANRIGEIDIAARITEAWQERGRDYVTAHISGSIIDYTVDVARDSVVDGSKELSREVDEFWTFTRPAGLNFWMLSAIQT